MAYVEGIRTCSSVLGGIRRYPSSSSIDIKGELPRAANEKDADGLAPLRPGYWLSHDHTRRAC